MRRRLLSSGIGFSVEPININNYLTIEALEDNLEVSFPKGAVKYCINGDGVWRNLGSHIKVSINSGNTISFKGAYTTSVGVFKVSKKFNLLGNCMSLLYGDNASSATEVNISYAFVSMFEGQPVVNVSKNFLPATSLSSSCYSSMFSGCSELISAPNLPATMLTSNCYAYMFYGCSALAVAPELPATTLVSNCYAYMFRDCENLNYVKMLAINNTSDNTMRWLQGVSETGTFVKNKEATWDIVGDDGVPSGWTIEYV